jgi:hypothetical protein
MSTAIQRFVAKNEIEELLLKSEHDFRKTPLFHAVPPWSKALEANADAIFAEVQTYIETNGPLKRCREVHPTQDSADVHDWRVLPIITYDPDAVHHTVELPLTRSLLRDVDIVSAYISFLKPGSNIPLHEGIFTGLLRYHLTLHHMSIIEKDAFIAFPTEETEIKEEENYVVADTVEDIIADAIPMPRYNTVVGDVKLTGLEYRRHWSPGEAFVFDDCHPHYVVHRGSGPRIVLIVDYIKKSVSAEARKAIKLLL